MSATPSAVLERWSQALDELEASASAEPSGPTTPTGLPGTLPPELEQRAREVLAQLVAASERVTGQMTAVRTELGAGPRRSEAPTMTSAFHLDVDA